MCVDRGLYDVGKVDVPDSKSYGTSFVRAKISEVSRSIRSKLPTVPELDETDE